MRGPRPSSRVSFRFLRAISSHWTSSRCRICLQASYRKHKLSINSSNSNSSHYLIYRNLVKSHCLLGGKKAIKSGQIGKLCIMSMIHCLALQTSLLVWKDVCICMLFWLFHLRTKSSDGIISRPLGHILVDRRQYFMCNRMNNRAWLLYFE